MIGRDEQNQIAGLKKSIAEAERAMAAVKKTISQIDACLRNGEPDNSHAQSAFSPDSRQDCESIGTCLDRSFDC